VTEPDSSDQVRTGALQVVFCSENRVSRAVAAMPGWHVDFGRGRETHRHDYTRPPAPLGDEVGGLSQHLAGAGGRVKVRAATLMAGEAMSAAVNEVSGRWMDGGEGGTGGRRRQRRKWRR